MIIHSYFKSESIMYITLALSTIFCANVNPAFQKSISEDDQDKGSFGSLFLTLLNHPYCHKHTLLFIRWTLSVFGFWSSCYAFPMKIKSSSVSNIFSHPFSNAFSLFLYLRGFLQAKASSSSKAVKMWPYCLRYACNNTLIRRRWPKTLR